MGKNPAGFVLEHLTDEELIRYAKICTICQASNYTITQDVAKELLRRMEILVEEAVPTE